MTKTQKLHFVCEESQDVRKMVSTECTTAPPPSILCDVKASCCNGDMPGGFIVIVGLLSCPLCPFDCNSTEIPP